MEGESENTGAPTRYEIASEDSVRIALEMLIEEVDSQGVQERVRALVHSVGPLGKVLLTRSELYRSKFLSRDGSPCKAFVMSIDIRRSSALMLKARTAKAFAEFVTVLCDELKKIVINHYGVFDKFTGDGVLAYFPDFYSGEHAGILAANAALACHAFFKKYYADSRHLFTLIPIDIGLGIGVDFGEVHIIRVVDSITVVGQAVVYACRLGGAPANSTYINQPAFERIANMNEAHFIFSEASINVKNEGAILAYSLLEGLNPVLANRPAWMGNLPQDICEGDRATYSMQVLNDSLSLI